MHFTDRSKNYYNDRLRELAEEWRNRDGLKFKTGEGM